ncbi:aldo/keto reductase [Flindersiella endophytica]
MRYRFLGTTGLKVSELCLGFMSFEREESEAAAKAVADRFVEAGGNFIDTADVYGNGTSETLLGRWLRRQRRDDLVIATKVHYPTGDGVNDTGLTRKHILSAVDRSLRLLQTDHIDLYQVHNWDSASRLEETLRTLNGLVDSGKVRYLGVSNFRPAQLQKAVDLQRANGWEPFSSLQPLYNLLDRQAEWELIPVAVEEGLGVIPWSPLRGGWLAGGYRRGSTGPLPGGRVEAASLHGSTMKWDNYAREETWRVLDIVHELAAETGRPAAQVSLNWVRRQAGVTAPIVGSRTLEQLEATLAALEWELTDEHLARLDKASAPEVPYPYWYPPRV